MMQQDTGYRKRTGRFLSAATAAAKTWYHADGDWVAPSTPAISRERMWLCCALYPHGAAALADAILRKAETERFRDHRFNIFDTNIAAALLVNQRANMAEDVRAKLTQLVRDGFSFHPGNRQPDYQFHGFNDNMPAKATLGLVLGGELLGDADAVAYGVWNLRQLRAMLVRNGMNSEYHSPTYTPLILHAMAEIAEHAQHPEARAIARGIEERLWIDLAARFHPEMGVLAGPYSRAYHVDCIAHLSCAASLLWFVLGDVARPSPMLLFEQDPKLVVHHEGDYPFNIAQMCWLAAGSYHVPAPARALFAGKHYPFRAAATAEQGYVNPDFPARPCRLETVLHPDFTVATVDTPFYNGEQTTSYFATYCRRTPVTSYRDVGTVFTKIVLDDEAPGDSVTRRSTSEVRGRTLTHVNTGEASMLAGYANTFAVQHDATALVLTHPRLALGSAPTSELNFGNAGRNIARLSELVIFPAHFGGAEELIVGGVPRETWAGTVARGEWIACRRGRLLIAIRPLAYSLALWPVALTLERVNHHECIRATFYRGEQRIFEREELRHTFGGFITEHAGVDDYPSLTAFATELSAAQFTDYFFSTRRTRYRRPAGSVFPALELETSWTPGTPCPRFAAVNGRRVEASSVQIDGIDPTALPFLNEPFTSVPGFFPWQDFAIEWGDWPSVIGDREI